VKLVKAIVRPNKADAIKDALAKCSVAGMTVTEVRGHGRQRGHSAVYRGCEYAVRLLPKIKITAVVPDETAEDVIAAITSSARTGEIGDGWIFVIPVEESRSIRTGERNVV